MERRDFLKGMGSVGIGAAGLGAWSDLVSQAHAATGEDYKAIVCLFMFGGNDSNNMVIPYDDARYAKYATDRRSIAIPKAQALPLTMNGATDYALHPNMVGMQNLINTGKAAIVANVGPLFEPITRAQWQAGQGRRPENLFSHSDQQLQWQTSSAMMATRSGWAGRIADMIAANNGANAGYTALSLSGNTPFLTGDRFQPYKVSASGNFGFDFYNPSGNDPLSKAITATLTRQSKHLFEQQWTRTVTRSIDNQRILTSALKSSTITTPFPNTGLATQLSMVAKLIAARGQLGLKRQAFFVSIGGFDTHGSDHYNSHGNSMGQVSAAITAFTNAMTELNLSENVTLFTASDFCRTYRPNGDNGTDHAWGANHFVVGGAVNGGQMYGKFADLTINGPDDTDTGRWIPTTSVDQMSATIAKWFGVSAGNMGTVFPNIGRFATADMGFMKAI